VTSSEVLYSAVFDVMPCAWSDHGFNLCRTDEADDICCQGCIGDGRRVDLSNGIPAAHRVITPEMVGRPCWLPDIEDEGSGGVW
jgi:hypothetical protein